MASIDEKKQNFKRIAEKRTEKIIDDLRLLGNLSNTSNYEYSSEDVEKIFNTLSNELMTVRSKFNSKKKKGAFKL
ncbi:hypothetical protein QUV96_10215 [Amedibacillus dolichus]|uniref:Aspartyl-phosphate phosphatase Spo0E family protein n=1 Tax=Amedibacillus dolichus TaxID=31971 RepID=A0ABT7UEH6_9FIRM|nr:hypothetical protein [Amedibacillus dolichus]MDM8158004.1 hypothetical protein [Amedibacillus dolichus]